MFLKLLKVSRKNLHFCSNTICIHLYKLP